MEDLAETQIAGPGTEPEADGAATAGRGRSPRRPAAIAGAVALAVVLLGALLAGTRAWRVLGPDDPSVLIGVPDAEDRKAGGDPRLLGPNDVRAADAAPAARRPGAAGSSSRGPSGGEDGQDDGPGVDEGGGGRSLARGRGRAEPPPRAGLARPDGRPWPAAIPYSSSMSVPSGLQFVLFIGSDARPGEDVARARADSIHLVAVNPKTKQGALVGIPRDSYVDIPGHGQGKINSALPKGGPKLLAATVRRLTGLPISYYVLTGFAGAVRLVDDLGGVDVNVDRRMDDRFSGAHFEPGWHSFDGNEALAFSRNRKDVAHGDFTRSEHQGVVMLSALAKMRGETGDDVGIRRWLDVLRRHCQLDVPATELPRLASLARRIRPDRLANVVVEGRVGKAGSQSVVFLGEEARRTFMDLRDDAVLGRPDGGPPPEPTTSTTSTTAAPMPGGPPSTGPPPAPPTTEADRLPTP